MRNDNISRQAALDAVSKWFVEAFVFSDSDKTAAIFKRLRDLPSTDQWIPCSERLPEEHEWIGTKMFGTTISDEVCITFDKNGERFVKVMSLQNGKLSNSDKETMDVFHKGWKMIAWMPLPEPYRKGGTE